MPVYRGELQCRGLGMDVEILDDEGRPVVAANRRTGLHWRRFRPCRSVSGTTPEGEKYRNAYFARFPGLWCHGDLAMLTEHDGIIIFGRSDTTLNPGGVRIGTAEIYRQVEQLPRILECVAVGQRWKGDERIVLFVRLGEGVTLDATLREQIRLQIRSNTTPRHVPAKIIAVDDIPRTSDRQAQRNGRARGHPRPAGREPRCTGQSAIDRSVCEHCRIEGLRRPWPTADRRPPFARAGQSPDAALRAIMATTWNDA